MDKFKRKNAKFCNTLDYNAKKYIRRQPSDGNMARRYARRKMKEGIRNDQERQDNSCGNVDC